MLKGIRYAVVLGMTCLAASVARAQSLTARQSTLSFGYVYGAGGDTHTYNGTVTDNALLATDSETAHFDGSTGGTLPGGTPYTAGSFYQIDQEYSLAGPLSAVQSIHATASTQVVTATTGAGVAATYASNPGNQIVFNFVTTAPLHYRLSGSINLPAASFFSYVTLQHFNGFNWEYVFTTAFSPTAVTPFDSSGMLPAGEYRIDTTITLNAQGNENWIGTYDYTLSFFKPGDMNCDGAVNGLDVMPFVTALLNPAAYATTWPTCDVSNADVNLSGAVNVDDVAPFVQCVVNGGC